MKIEYRHNLTKEESYQKASNIIGELQKKYSDMISNPQMYWNSSHDKMDFSFNAKRFDIKGNLHLENNKLTLEGKIPFMLGMFSGKIEGMIRKQLDELLA